MPKDAELQRKLGLADAVVIGLGAMIGAGIFAALSPAAAAAGSGLLVGLAVAAVIAYCNATSSARLAARYPEIHATITEAQAAAEEQAVEQLVTAGAGEGRHEGGHQVGAPVPGELARVDQLQRTPRIGVRRCLTVGPCLGGRGHEGIRDHRGEHEGAARGLGNVSLQNGAGVLGLGEHHAAGGGDRADDVQLCRGRATGRVAELGHVGPEPTGEGALAGGLRTEVDAAHHDDVRVEALCEILQHLDGTGAVHLVRARLRVGLVQRHTSESP